jgi:SanA protein
MFFRTKNAHDGVQMSKKRKFLRCIKICFFLFFLFFLYMSPFSLFWFRFHRQIAKSLDQTPPAETVIIFGTIIRNGEISPLLYQRLEAGYQVWKAGKVQKIVVSNMPAGAEVMKKDLLARGVPEEAIEVDTAAYTTPDTCRAEKTHQINEKSRSVLFVSQEYHLPRLMYQCERLGVVGNGVAAEDFVPVSNTETNPGMVLLVRYARILREGLLSWASFVTTF